MKLHEKYLTKNTNEVNESAVSSAIDFIFKKFNLGDENNVVKAFNIYAQKIYDKYSNKLTSTDKSEYNSMLKELSGHIKNTGSYSKANAMMFDSITLCIQWLKKKVGE